jgi:hypothetical protein
MSGASWLKNRIDGVRQSTGIGTPTGELNGSWRGLRRAAGLLLLHMRQLLVLLRVVSRAEGNAG